MTVPPGFDNRIGLLASRQASAFSCQHALAAGATHPMIARRHRSGGWTRAHPGVYVLTGSSPSWIQDVWCAVGTCLRQVARRGKPGTAKLARVLDARSVGPVPAGSDLERCMFAALAAGVASTHSTVARRAKVLPVGARQ